MILLAIHLLCLRHPINSNIVLIGGASPIQICHHRVRDEDSKDMLTWQRALILFDKMLVLRARSTKTHLAYRRDIICLKKLSKVNSPLLVKTDHIQQTIFQLRLTLDGRSIGRMLSAWRGFFACLLDHQYIDSNCCVGVKVPRSGKRLPKALSIDAIQYLLDHVKDKRDILQIRDYALFELMYSSGIRLSEAVNLNLQDIELR